MSQHVYEDTVNPSAAPPAVGAHWVNTATGAHFFAKGVATVDDWVEGGGGAGAGGTDNTSGYVVLQVSEVSEDAESSVLVSADGGRNYARTPDTPAASTGTAELSNPTNGGNTANRHKMLVQVQTP